MSNVSESVRELTIFATDGKIVDQDIRSDHTL